jgi:thymidylate synthase (FAD)
MKIIQPYAKIVNMSSQVPLWQIEQAARISHASEDQQTETSATRFVKEVIVRRGDWSVVEHVSISVEFKVDRGITHELVRHRLFSYTQSSTRFINYVKKMPPEFIYPKPDIVCQFTHYEKELHTEECPYELPWLMAVKGAENAYIRLLEQGWRPQEARSVFPNALASKILMTGNLRNWRHFFLMRTTKEAHPQMRQITIPLLAEFKSTVPILFDDIEPEESQIMNIQKGR